MIKEEIKAAKNQGLSAEKILEITACAFDDVLEKIEDSHNKIYESAARDIHEKLSGPHYDSTWAEIDVQNISYTNREKRQCTGAHWTMNEILDATRGKEFPAGTTDWDKYVAYNATYADFNRKFDDAQICDIAFLFYFADEDWNGKGKIWEYMSANH